MSFAGQVKVATLNLRGYQEEVVKSTLFKAVSMIIKRTPVDEGRARGNWQATIGAPTKAPTPKQDKSGQPTISAAQNVINAMEMGQTFYLTNNLPYIEVLEFGGYPNPPKGGQGKTANGFSRKAPQGMVRITLTEIARALR